MQISRLTSAMLNCGSGPKPSRSKPEVGIGLGILSYVSVADLTVRETGGKMKKQCEGRKNSDPKMILSEVGFDNPTVGRLHLPPLDR